MAVGPFEQVALPGGGAAPLYLLRYAADGRLSSPQAEAHLRAAATTATDVFLFAHGWNNVFGQALAHYRRFVAGYLAMKRDLGLPVAQPYRPLLVGVVWPSTSFVQAFEQGPDIAGGPGGDDGGEVEELLRFVSESLDPVAADELSELVDGVGRLGDEQARRAVEIVLPADAARGDADGAASPPSVETMLDAWSRVDGVSGIGAASPVEFGTVDGAVTGWAAQPDPQAAGLGSFNPRTVLRLATVWKMKARAGAVGVRGVSPLLRDLLARSDARLHLIGHSFGARLVLSAMAGEPVTRPARSMLLLQAAVNRWCFAPDVVGSGRAGGFHRVPARVERPVLATLTGHDQPLRLVFHLLMRGGQLGEPQLAAVGDEERYGALGGYGPAGLGAAAATVPVRDPGDRYELPAGAKVVAVDGSRTMIGHGDINNPSTWWMLHTLAGA